MITTQMIAMNTDETVIQRMKAGVTQIPPAMLKSEIIGRKPGHLGESPPTKAESMAR